MIAVIFIILIADSVHFWRSKRPVVIHRPMIGEKIIMEVGELEFRVEDIEHGAYKNEPALKVIVRSIHELPTDYQMANRYGFEWSGNDQ